MESAKIIGWILVAAGVALIVWSLWASYGILTAKKEAARFFKLESKPSVSDTAQLPTTPEEIRQQTQDMIARQLQEMLPLGTVEKILNLLVWTMLAGILIFGGTQIAAVGANLLKK